MLVFLTVYLFHFSMLCHAKEWLGVSFCDVTFFSDGVGLDYGEEFFSFICTILCYLEGSFE